MNSELRIDELNNASGRIEAQYEAMPSGELDHVKGGLTIQSGYERPTLTVYQATALDLYVVNPPISHRPGVQR